jgi:hypothetical protein
LEWFTAASRVCAAHRRAERGGRTSGDDAVSGPAG